jgi:type 1 fimbriae regulatory protein FimB/type 1 fimbriae regulatory protein FimE
MRSKLNVIAMAKTSEMQTENAKRHGRLSNSAYRTREHLMEAEIGKVLEALKHNRCGYRDRLMGLLTFRHGLRVSELIQLQWPDINFAQGEIFVRRLKGSQDANHYLEADEINGLRRLRRDGPTHERFVFLSERGTVFTRDGVLKMLKRAGEAAGLPFAIHPHMLRHSTGFKAANDGIATRTVQHLLGHKNIAHSVRYSAMSAKPLAKIQWKQFAP